MLIAAKTTYELSIGEIAHLLANELDVPLHQIQVEYVIGYHDPAPDRRDPGGPGVPYVEAVRVVVDRRVRKPSDPRD